MSVRGGTMTLLLDQDWKKDAPWVAEWMPGGDNTSSGEHVLYNHEINECLVSSGMGKYVAWLVLTPDLGKGRAWEVWLGLADNPSLNQKWICLKDHKGQPIPLDGRVYDYVFSCTEVKSLRGEDMTRLREKFREERQKVQDNKVENSRQAFAEESAKLANRDPNSAEAREARIQHGDQGYFRVGDVKGNGGGKPAKKDPAKASAKGSGKKG